MKLILNLHFIVKETEAYRAKVICPRSWASRWQSLDAESGHVALAWVPLPVCALWKGRYAQQGHHCLRSVEALPSCFMCSVLSQTPSPLILMEKDGIVLPSLKIFFRVLYATNFVEANGRHISYITVHFPKTPEKKLMTLT